MKKMVLAFAAFAAAMAVGMVACNAQAAELTDEYIGCIKEENGFRTNQCRMYGWMDREYPGGRNAPESGGDGGSGGGAGGAGGDGASGGDSGGGAGAGSGDSGCK